MAWKIADAFSAGEVVPYADVMLDWAISEATSPRWRHLYENGLASTTLAAIEPVDLDPTKLAPAQRDELVCAVEIVRSNILAHYGVQSSWRFCRVLAPIQVVGQFGTLWEFNGRTVEEQVQVHSPDMDAMERAVKTGATLRGCPIAVACPGSEPPVLIDGYGRCNMAFRTRRSELRIFLGGQATR